MAKRDVDLLEGENAGLVKLDISRAETDGTLKHSASVLSTDNDTLTPGLVCAGPRVINFANILKYDYIPLASHTEDKCLRWSGKLSEHPVGDRVCR
ncbi:MAG: hypothetical protein MZV63_54840 [Marinilabiliales bacterium]|nr:hypothetical protein [Marinilabiliales bacterium]